MITHTKDSVSFNPQQRSKNVAGAITAAIVTLSFLLGCSATPRIFQADSNLLAASGYDFIQDGMTTREELRVRIGVPVYEFENKRILIYRCQKLEKEIVLLDSVQPYAATGIFRAQKTAHPELGSLVLVFDANGVLQKHSLVMSQ